MRSHVLPRRLHVLARLLVCTVISVRAYAACQNLPLSGQVSGSLTASNLGTDKWCFSITQDTFLLVKATSAPQFSGVGLCYYNGTTVQNNTTVVACGSQSVNSHLRPGTYTLSVQGDYTQAYTLQMYSSTPSLPNDTEPNDSPSTATTVVLNTTVTGHVGFGGNGPQDTQDWYKVTLPQGQVLSVTITTPNDCPSGQSFYCSPLRPDILVHAPPNAGGQYQQCPQSPSATGLSAPGDYTIGVSPSSFAYCSFKDNGGAYALTITATAQVVAPQANFAWSPQQPPASQPVTFTDTSTGSPTSWTWTFGDGSGSSAQNPTHTYITAGSYTVKLVAANTAGNSMVTKTVSVTAAPVAPVANFTFSPANPSATQSVSFTDTSTGAPTSWNWTFGDSSGSSTQNPSHAYATAGTFTVTLVATNATGTSTASKTITVAAAGSPPLANFTFSPASPAAGQPVTFTDTSSGAPTAWSWAFGDSGTASTSTVPHTFAAAGTYTVALTVSNNYGSNSTSKQVLVGSGLAADFSFSPTNATAGSPVQFTDRSAGSPVSWSWTFGDNATSTAANPVHTYAAAGSYTVGLTITKGAAQNSTSKSVSVAAAAATLSVSNVNFTNQGNVANRLDVWLDATENGVTLDPSSYVLRVIASDGKTQLTTSGIAELVSGVRWHAALQIYTNPSTGTPWFEAGALEIARRSDPNDRYIVPSLILNAYGTDFDMHTHAYQFANSRWNLPLTLGSWWSDAYFKIADTVANYLAPTARKRFWQSVGDYHFFYTQSPRGLCAGMTNSAIANFTHRGQSAYWTDIASRWPAMAPDKPFSSDDIFNSTFISNAFTGTWTTEAAKKIMFYHVTFPAWEGVANAWPGRDSYANVISNASIDAVHPDCKALLKSGNPVSLYLRLDQNRAHQVATTQLIQWTATDRGTNRFVVYDNDSPSPNGEQSGLFAPFEELTFTNAPASQLISLDQVEPTGTAVPTGKATNSAAGNLAFLTSTGDSQHIYASSSGVNAATSTDLSVQPVAEADNLILAVASAAEGGDIGVIAIGADTLKVYDATTQVEVPLTQNGIRDGVTAVYAHEPGGLLTEVYLPLGQSRLYRVEISKSPLIARLKIFTSVPNTQTIDAVGYDNIQVTDVDPTKVLFYVGAANADHILSRTSGSGVVDTVVPTFAVSSPLPPPARRRAARH